MKYIGIFGLLVALMIGSGCRDNFEEQIATDQQLIEDYVADNSLEGEYTDEGVFIAVMEEGAGSETPTVSSDVEAIYEGYLLDGTVFDSSEGFPRTFNLGRVVRGWQIAFPRLTRDTKATIIIPSRHGYGTRPPSSLIPANAVLVFDVELVDF